MKLISAYIYHYGWVRNPLFMQEKFRDFGQHWTGEADHEKWQQQQIANRNEFDYSNIDSLTVFDGTHPEVMKERVAGENWNFNHDIKKKNFKNFKHRFLYWLQQGFGIRPFEYSNYKKI
ncbi:MAG: hypothetical protein WDO71_01550 [Bacteroidota bacterium]